MRIPNLLRLLPFLILSACGGGSGTSGSTAAPVVNYTIGGSLNGLASDETLTLRDNGADPLTLPADGTFTFATSVASGGNYDVTVATDPTGQTCSIASGTGTIAADVSNVAVTCAASTEKVLHAFASGADGSQGYVGLVQGSDGDFYGVTVQGGVHGDGILFKITAAGTLTKLHDFGATGDGIYPYANLILGADGNLYGTTTQGGVNSHGTVFKATTAGVVTIVYSFGNGSDGQGPNAGLTLGTDGNFYGVTNYGGTSNMGTVYKLTPSGTETVLHSFTGSSDGKGPFAGLIQAIDGNFYGTTLYGGATNSGTVFKITPGGTETILYAFAGGSDGDLPYGGVIQASDGNFYGTTGNGGTGSYGTVYKITAAGTETVIYSFAGNGDGTYPEGTLLQAADGDFYGTTYSGGAANFGTLFKISATGTESVLSSFTGTSDGAHPEGNLMQGTDGHFYGFTSGGDISTDYGTVFRF